MHFKIRCYNFSLLNMYFKKDFVQDFGVLILLKLAGGGGLIEGRGIINFFSSGGALNRRNGLNRGTTVLLSFIILHPVITLFQLI